jgi:hypothetical protein
MKKFLNELARLWWVEVGTELKNPISEKSLNGLRVILKEEYDFDSETIEYIIESAVKTPTNFHLGGNRESGMQVGSNDTAVSAHLHSDEDDDKDGAIDYDEPLEEEEKDEEEDSKDEERPDGGDDKEKVIKDLSKNALTAYEKDKLKKEDVYVKNKKSGSVYTVKKVNPETHVEPSKDDIEKAKEDDKSDTDDTPKEVKGIENGTLSDSNDELSDGAIKQKGLEIGYKETDDFKPAPGNAGSMLAEIMTGEVASILENNPNMSDEELFEAIYNHVKDTTLGKQNGDYTKKTNKSGKYADKNADLMKKCESIGKAGREKHQRMNEGVDKLANDGKITKPVKTRNFYGHKESIDKQVQLIEKSEGPFYTNNGVEVPKDVLIDLIKKSGGGENPSDTSSIAMDENGRGVVTFHSDKLSTADIQANSTPNKESENAKEIIDSSDLSDDDKKKSKSTIENGQKKLAEKESELKEAANGPSREMANADLSEILKNAKNNTNSDGTPNKDKTSTRLGKIHGTRETKKRILKYLPDGASYDDASEEQRLKAYFDYMGDDNKEIEPTGDQVKFLYRVAKQNGYDISSTLGKIREESLQIQRDTHSELNEQSVTLPNGDKKPMGDFIEAKNVMDKLHIGVVDGEDGKGVGKYPGLFNLNMGGTVVEADELKNCLNVDNSDDFVTHFDVGEPGDGEEVTKNVKTGQTTGRNIFVYAVTKDGKRTPLAVKTQRSKQGEDGKLSTTYQWHKDTQNCFKTGKRK